MDNKSNPIESSTASSLGSALQHHNSSIKSSKAGNSVPTAGVNARIYLVLTFKWALILLLLSKHFFYRFSMSLAGNQLHWSQNASIEKEGIDT